MQTFLIELKRLFLSNNNDTNINAKYERILNILRKTHVAVANTNHFLTECDVPRICFCDWWLPTEAVAKSREYVIVMVPLVMFNPAIE